MQTFCFMCKEPKTSFEITTMNSSSPINYCSDCISRETLKINAILEKKNSVTLRTTGNLRVGYCKSCNNATDEILNKLCPRSKKCKKCFFSSSESCSNTCKYCPLIINSCCRNCLQILRDNEKIVYEESPCQIYCQACSKICKNKIEYFKRQSKLEIPEKNHKEETQNPETNESPSKTLNSPHQNSSYDSIIPQSPTLRNTKSFKSISAEISYDSLPATSSITSNFYSTQNNLCFFCKKSEVIYLECGHFSCFECMKYNFIKDFIEFIENIRNRKESILNKAEVCIKCPLSYQCGVKYVFPFDSQWVEDYVRYYRLSQEWVNHYSPFFDGVSFRFKKCSSCGMFSGNRDKMVCFFCRPEVR